MTRKFEKKIETYKKQENKDFQVFKKSDRNVERNKYSRPYFYMKCPQQLKNQAPTTRS